MKLNLFFNKLVFIPIFLCLFFAILINNANASIEDDVNDVFNEFDNDDFENFENIDDYDI